MKREFLIYGVVLILVGILIVVLRSFSLVEYKLTVGDLLITVLTFVITMMVTEFINTIVLHKEGQFPGSSGPAASRALRRLLQDMGSTDLLERREAAQQFGSLSVELSQALKQLSTMSSDPDQTVQQAATQAISRYPVTPFPP